jgi:hypothetical protein
MTPATADDLHVAIPGSEATVEDEQTAAPTARVAADPDATQDSAAPATEDAAQTAAQDGAAPAAIDEASEEALAVEDDEEEETTLRLAKIQRRDRHRVRTQLWARIEFPVSMDVQLLDLSLSGARLDRDFAYPAGTQVHLVVETHKHGELPINSEIVWVRGGETGLRFSKVSERQAAFLREALMKEELRNIRSGSGTQPRPTA